MEQNQKDLTKQAKEQVQRWIWGEVQETGIGSRQQIHDFLAKKKGHICNMLMTKPTFDRFSKLVENYKGYADTLESARMALSNLKGENPHKNFHEGKLAEQVVDTLQLAEDIQKKLNDNDYSRELSKVLTDTMGDLLDCEKIVENYNDVGESPFSGNYAIYSSCGPEVLSEILNKFCKVVAGFESEGYKGADHE